MPPGDACAHGMPVNRHWGLAFTRKGFVTTKNRIVYGRVERPPHSYRHLCAGEDGGNLHSSVVSHTC